MLDKYEEEIVDEMIRCDCQPVGETNVVDCNCGDEWEDYEIKFGDEELLEFYTGKLQLKQSRIKEYIEEKNSFDGFASYKREMEYYVLKAEVELLTRFVDELED